jgi:Flp pilus assembly protein TadG
MGQLFAVLLNVMVLLLVPLGIMQVHTVVQTKNELLEVSAAAAKYVSNHGGTDEATIHQAVQAFILRELSEKKLSLSGSDLTVTITRTYSADPIVWSHEDEFELRVEAPYPRLTELFPLPAERMQVTRQGTVNVMDYDL